jgi:hypothetical protein
VRDNANDILGDLKTAMHEIPYVLTLSYTDSTWLSVREYSREFASERKAAGLKAIPLVNGRDTIVATAGDSPVTRYTRPRPEPVARRARLSDFARSRYFALMARSERICHSTIVS